MMRVKHGGWFYDLSRKKIEDSLKGVEPETGRRFFISVYGKEFPIKQVCSAAAKLRLAAWRL